jgi:hypothetical protein
MIATLGNLFLEVSAWQHVLPYIMSATLENLFANHVYLGFSSRVPVKCAQKILVHWGVLNAYLALKIKYLSAALNIVLLFVRLQHVRQTA